MSEISLKNSSHVNAMVRSPFLMDSTTDITRWPLEIRLTYKCDNISHRGRDSYSLLYCWWWSCRDGIGVSSGADGRGCDCSREARGFSARFSWGYYSSVDA